ILSSRLNWFKMNFEKGLVLMSQVKLTGAVLRILEIVSFLLCYILLIHREPNHYFVFIVLRNKFFVSDLIVKNDLTLNDYVTINGVDLSELYHQLDTVASFNTPLEVNEILIGGNMVTTQFN